MTRLSVRKTKLLQCLAYGVYAAVIPAGIERRSNACDNGSVALEHYAHSLGIVNDFLRVLRADDEALAAQDAFIADNMRLMSGEADGLDGASAYASMAVLAV